MRPQIEPRDDFGGGRQLSHRMARQDLFLRSRNSPNTSAALRPFIRTLAATDGSSARRNTFAFFSSPSRVGMVGLFAARSRVTSSARAFSAALSGSIGQREFDIGGGVFMAAIEFEIVGQRPQLEQRVPHHRVVALEHPPAADREQRVGGKQRLLVVEDIADVVERMARRFQHAAQKAADLHDVALADAQIDVGDPGGLVVRRDHPAAVFLLQLGDAADMVVMMMGDQDIGQRPALALQRLDDGGCFRRIDRGGRLGLGIVNQIAEIVGEAGEQANFGSHDISVDWARR